MGRLQLMKDGGLDVIGPGLLAVVLGVPGFLPLLGVLFTGPGSLADWRLGEVGAAGLTLGIYFVCGAAIGYVKPTAWMIGGLLAWLCILFSLYNLAAALSDPVVRKGWPVALLVLIVPPVVALTGADVGRRWRRRAARRP